MAKEMLFYLGIGLLAMFGLISGAHGQPASTLGAAPQMSPPPEFLAGRVHTDADNDRIRKESTECILTMRNYGNLVRSAMGAMDSIRVLIGTAKASGSMTQDLKMQVDRIEKVRTAILSRQEDWETAYGVYVEGKHPNRTTLSDVRDAFLMEYCNCITQVAQFQCRYLELRKDWAGLKAENH